MILTLSHPQDFHAFVVQEALARKGREMTFWYTLDLAQLQRASLEIGNGEPLEWSIAGEGFQLERGPVTSLWMRRAEPPVIGDQVHPSDRPFAEAEYGELFRWLIAMLPREAFWVNPQQSRVRVRSKLEQQRVARRLGMRIPETLYSNDPARIREFLRRQGGRMAYKSFGQQGPWVMGEWGFAYLYTSVVTEELLRDDAALRAAPGIYQELLPKDYELRVTVIGNRVFPARIDSQSTREGRVDWRLAQNEIRCRPAEIPAELERAILALMAEMDLAYGAFDFVVTPAGEHVFLEVNEAGQFLFVEEHTEVPMLDAFCELLIQGRADFDWRPEKARVRLLEVADAALAEMQRAKVGHPDPPGRHAGVEAGLERLARPA